MKQKYKGSSIKDKRGGGRKRRWLLGYVPGIAADQAPDHRGIQSGLQVMDYVGSRTGRVTMHEPLPVGFFIALGQTTQQLRKER